MDSNGGLLEAILQAVARKHMVEAIFISTMVVLFYDWLLILPQEVKYIWRSSWNYTKLLFLLIRYTPFVSMALMVRNQFSTEISPSSCKMSLQAACWISVIGMDLTEIVLSVRTYAIWNKDKRVGIGLALLLALCQIPNGIIVGKFMAAVNFVENPYSAIYRGCLALSASKIIYVNWVMFTVMEGVVLVLMVISALRTYRKNTSNLLNVVYVDGIKFYLYMFVVTFTNVLTTLLLPINFVAIGSCLEIVLHSNLACRLMVELREAAQTSGFTSDAFELSEITNDDTVVFVHEDERRWPAESIRMDRMEAQAGPSEP